MSHDSVGAAIVYQHATTEADARIALALAAALTGNSEAEEGGVKPTAPPDAGRPS